MPSTTNHQWTPFGLKSKRFQFLVCCLSFFCTYTNFRIELFRSLMHLFCSSIVINEKVAVNCFYGWQISILINFKKIFEHFLNNNNNDNIITSRDAQCFWCSLFNAFSDLTVAHLPIVGCHKIIDVYNFIIWKRPCIRWRRTNERMTAHENMAPFIPSAESQ